MLHCVAIYLAQRLSFSDVFSELMSTYHVDNTMAWNICVRAKRGLANTVQPIAFTRDSVYYAGYRLVKEYLDKEKDAGLKQLYVGKIGVGGYRGHFGVGIKSAEVAANLN